MLRRLEESILTGNVPLVGDESRTPTDQSFQKSSSSSFNFIGKTSGQTPLTIKTNMKSVKINNLPSSSSPYHNTIATDRRMTNGGGLLCSCSNEPFPSEIQSRSATFSPQSSLQVVRFVLFKDPKYNDFGFSISEGFNGEGVYINKIRLNGPADKADIKSCDKVLMVTQKFFIEQRFWS